MQLVGSFSGEVLRGSEGVIKSYIFSDILRIDRFLAMRTSRIAG